MSKGLLIYFVVVCLILSAILLGLVASSVDSFLGPVKPAYHMKAENVIQEQQPKCRWIGNSCIVMQNIP